MTNKERLEAIYALTEDYKKSPASEMLLGILEHVSRLESPVFQVPVIDDLMRLKHLHKMTKKQIEASIPKVDESIETPESHFEFKTSIDDKPAIYLQKVDEGEVVVETRDTLSDICYKLLIDQNMLVSRGGMIGYLKKEDFSWTWEMSTTEQIRGLLTRYARFLNITTSGKGRNVQFNEKLLPQPPDFIPIDILSNQSTEKLQYLRAILSYPYLYKSEIQNVAGFNAETGIFRTPESVEALDIPESPEACVDTIKEVLSDFPFVSESDFTAAVSIPLTMMVYPSFKASDMAPLFVISAASPGTGKTELARALGCIVSGRILEETMLSEEKKEIALHVFSKLLTGETYSIFDNVEQDCPVDSGYLASVVTSPFREQRILGQSKIVKCENAMITVFTGNNVQATRELVDRGVLIELDSPAERSSDRTFKYKNLSEHILTHREKFLGAFVGMIQNWIDAGQPTSSHKHRLRNWASVVGGILEVNGIGEHFLKNTLRFLRTADKESSAWAMAFNAIFEKYGEKPFTMDDIFEIVSYHKDYYSDGKHHEANGENLLGEFIKPARDDHPRKVSVGVLFRKRVGQTLNGMKLTEEPRIRNRKQYKLTKVDDAC